MKTIPFLISIAPLSIATALAATSYNFDSEGEGESVKTGNVPGWSQNTTNPNFFDQEFPLGYTSDVTFYVGGPQSRGLYLGTLKIGLEEDADPTTLTGEIDDVGSVAGSRITVNIGMEGNPEKPLDTFIFDVLGAGGSLISLNFMPSGADEWTLGYSIAGSSVTSTFSTVQADRGYVFLMDFLEDTIRISYGSAESGDPGNLIAEISTSAASDETYDKLKLTLVPDQRGGSENALIIDNFNISPIPEPSMLMLSAGAAVAGLIRRRRA